MSEMSRREFLKMGVKTSVGLGGLFFSQHPIFGRLKLVEDPKKDYPYRDWEDLYREDWSWDKVVRSTHSSNCTGSCSWNVYVKDGLILREEQAGDFPRINDQVPDYNPRGCQKGACYVDYIYGPKRVKYPLIRTGERGEGRWRRASWDEALEKIAEKLVTTVREEGPETINFYTVIPAMSPISFAGGIRFAHYLGGVAMSFYDWYCDLPPGQPLTWGVQTEAAECADFYNAKYIILWGSNVNETRIPDAHFVWEAKYNGAQVVCISPDYNSSAIHADLWTPIRPGTDGALALGMAHVIISEELYDHEYIREQTDLPFLVRSDNRRFLREADLIEGGSEDRFYFWDHNQKQPVLAPGSMGDHRETLELGDYEPALEGTYQVDTEAGNIEVKPVFEILKEMLADHTPEQVAGVTDIPARLIRRLGREFGKTRPAMIIHGAGTNHWYHNDLNNRAMMLLVTLTGNVGRNGGGFNHYVGQEKIWSVGGFNRLCFPEGTDRQRFQNTTLWTYSHSKGEDYEDELGIKDYIDQSIDRGWMPLYPRGDKEPRMMFIWRGNYLNQSKGFESVKKNLWPKLDLIVNLNFHMDTTALNSDIVLPAASYYEKTDINQTDVHSYVHPFNPAIDPLWESKSDWQIFRELAEKFEEVARREGLKEYADQEFGWTRKYHRFYEDWSKGEELAGDRAAVQYILDHSVETEGLTLEAINEKPRRFVATDPYWNSDIEEGVVYTPYKRQVEGKRPWKTLTGRQQYYIDHEWFLDFGEELPVFKKPLERDDYPLLWNTPHERWSVHSTWRNSRQMLRLQRGEPVVFINPEEAQKRGIADHDWVRIYNDHGHLVCRAKILPSEPMNRLTMYHGWERYLGFKEGGWQSPTPIRIKPTQLIGGYGHINFRLNYWGPTGNNRDIRVEIEKYGRD